MTILSTLACTIDKTGISAPPLSAILGSLQSSFRSIYGNDVYLGNDSQDGQWLGILAKGYNDTNNAMISVYNSFSPATAQGIGLSNVVKINGMKRIGGAFSTAPITVSGIGGATIRNGIIGDNLGKGTQWALPSTVQIPPGSGSVQVIATCLATGNVTAPSGSLTVILSPQYGFQAVTNTDTATPGVPTESDSILRQRQAVSTSLPAIGPAAGALAAIKNIAGVTDRSTYYENVTASTDGNGVPARSIAFVIEGGDPVAIATTLSLKKFPGTSTYGTTTEVIPDQAGVNNTINFFVMGQTGLEMIIAITALAGYLPSTAGLIQKAVQYFVNNQLAIGQDSYLSALYAPARLSGDAAVLGTGFSQSVLDGIASTYNITSIKQDTIAGGTPSVQDIIITFSKAALVFISNITINQT